MMNLGQLRRAYHEAICRQVLGYRAGVPNIADKSSFITRHEMVSANERLNLTSNLK